MDYEKIMALEGDEKDFSYKGYKCHIRRIGKDYSGHLCGYIEIPFGHPLYEKEYDEIELMYDYDLPAHGGLTFSGFVNKSYWIGFDCAHAGDICPKWPNWMAQDGTYKDMHFVTENIFDIVDFIEERANGKY